MALETSGVEASEVKSCLRFEISHLNYLPIHMHIAYMITLVASEATYSLQTA